MTETDSVFKLTSLLARAKQRQNSALGELLMHYRGYLSLLARAQLGARLKIKVDASDVIQETFFEAQRDFSQFRGSTEAELLAWLRRILATNLANSVRRFYGTQLRDVRLERSLADSLEMSSKCIQSGIFCNQSSPSQRASKREQAVILAEALNRLPSHYREVILLRNVEGRSFSEVAQCMERSIDSVQKIWVRGLAQLRRTMGESI